MKNHLASSYSTKTLAVFTLQFPSKGRCMINNGCQLSAHSMTDFGVGAFRYVIPTPHHNPSRFCSHSADGKTKRSQMAYQRPEPVNMLAGTGPQLGSSSSKVHAFSMTAVFSMFQYGNSCSASGDTAVVRSTSHPLASLHVHSGLQEPMAPGQPVS